MASGWDGMEVGRAVAGVVPGDHLSCAFGSDEEQRQLVGRAARDAFGRGDRVRYAADRTEAQTLCHWLEDAGLDVRAALAAGQLEIVSCQKIYRPGRTFDPERQLAGLAAQVDRARADGFRGLTVTGEMSWLRGRPEEAEGVLAYEERIGHALEGSGLVTICQYDRRLFPADLLAPLARAHEFRVETRAEGSLASHGAVTLHEGEDGMALAGEVDFCDADYVGARVAAHGALESEIVVDAADLEFIDLAGCRALVRAAARLPADRRALIVDPPPGMVRVMELCGWAGDPRIAFVHRDDPPGPQRR